MLSLGILALLQICLLPGLICLKLSGLKSQSRVEQAVYTFAFSLICNHFIVWWLSALALYTRPVLLALVLLEMAVIAYLYRKSNFGPTVEVRSIRELFHSADTTSKKNPLQTMPLLLILLPALAAVASFCELFVTNIGSVFHHWDDIVSWNRWAITWAETQAVRDSTYYPQLLPTNWSLTYLLMGNRDVPMFAKVIMPLFPLAIVLLYLDMYRKSRNAFWIAGAGLFTLSLRYVWTNDIISSGLVELPTAFFTFVALHAVFQLKPNPRENTFIQNSMPILLAGGAALSKQGALYFLVCALIWYVLREWSVGREKRWTRVGAGVGLTLFMLSWYIVKQISILTGVETNSLLFYLTQTIHAGRSYSERWWHAIQMLQTLQLTLIRPCFWIFVGLTFMSLFHKQGIRVFLLLVAPFYVLWAFLFSYDQRGIVLMLPLVSFCAGCGLDVIGRQFATAFSATGNRRQRTRAFIAALSIVLAGLAIWLIAEPDHSAKRSLVYVMRSPWWAELYVTWLKFMPWMVALLLLPKFKLNLGLRLHPGVLSLPVIALALFLQATLLTDQKVIAMNLQELKKASDAKLNEKLYFLKERGVIEGVVITDYLTLEQLPDLRQHFRVNGLSLPPTVDNLKAVATTGTPLASFMLFRSDCFNSESDEWLKENGYKVLFDRVGKFRYRLIQSPKTLTSGLRGAL